MPWFGKKLTRCSAALGALLGLLPVLSWPQQFSKSDRDLVQDMLRNVARDVQKNYYDPKFHGVDWDATVRKAKGNIDKADSLNGAVSEIAAALDSLNDSGTFFVPPPRTYVHDYGFTMHLIGEGCFVTRVRPGSDAEKKGLKAGDQILAINEHRLSRKTLWRVFYIYGDLDPQPGLRLTLTDEGGQQRQLEVGAKIETSSGVRYFLQHGLGQRIRDWQDVDDSMVPRYFEKGDSLLVVKIPYPSALDVDRMIRKMRKHKGVVIDLRGSGGGRPEILKQMLGGIFEHEVKIYDRIGKASTRSESAVGRHHDAFTGRLAVLIDSQSAEASELFARVVQMEKRGFIIGDRSTGHVDLSKGFFYETYLDSEVFYRVFVTDANLVMTDGKSLEHVGVEPDITVLPTPHDLARGRDPAMAKAAALVGGQLSPEEAGRIFPDAESPQH
ncbi:MAG: PDZ domain-containing protein [Acidobacteria bacterium]|nr:PDZ domain-containing protein [Acidobacteriota bacterium]